MASETQSGKTAVAVLDPNVGSAITDDLHYTVTPSGVVMNRVNGWQDATPKDSFTVGDAVEQKLRIPPHDYVDLSSIEITGRLKCPVSATGEHQMPKHGINAFIRSMKLECGGATIFNITQWNHAARHHFLTRVTDAERNQFAATEFMQGDNELIWSTSFDKRYGTYGRCGETAANSGVGIEVPFRIRPFHPFLRKKKLWPMKYSGEMVITITWETDTKYIAERWFAYGHAISGCAALNYTGAISEVKVEYHRCTLMNSLDKSMLRQLESGNGFSMSYSTLDSQLGNWGPARTGTMVFDANHTNVHALFVYFQNNYVANNAITDDLSTNSSYDYCNPGFTDVFATVGGVVLPTSRTRGVTEGTATDAITTTAILNARKRRTDNLEFWNNYVYAVKGLDNYMFDGQNSYESFHAGGLEAAADALTSVVGNGMVSDTATIETSAKFDTKFEGLSTIRKEFLLAAHGPIVVDGNSCMPMMPKYDKRTCSFALAVPLRTQAATLSGFSGLQSSRAINLVFQSATTRTNAINFTVRSFLEYTAVASLRLARLTVTS